MIHSQNLTFAYGPEKTFLFPDIQCNNRQALVILGRSGQGKTTLLHLLGLLLQPQSGSIWVNNQDITSLSVADAAVLRASQIGIVYQRPHFVSSLSVLDNILVAKYLAKKTQDKNRVRELAAQLGFEQHLAKKTNQLSLGEQQRVGIARALVNNPSVVLADEPTSNLDDYNCARVVETLQNQSQQIGASLVVVTHDQRLKDVLLNQVIL